MIKTEKHRRRQLEKVEPTFKENKQLHAEVKAREDEIVGLKEERSRLQARLYQVQLEKKDLSIERDIARDELAASQEQLGETASRLAVVSEQKNGKTVTCTAFLRS